MMYLMWYIIYYIVYYIYYTWYIICSKYSDPITHRFRGDNQVSSGVSLPKVSKSKPGDTLKLLRSTRVLNVLTLWCSSPSLRRKYIYAQASRRDPGCRGLPPCTRTSTCSWIADIELGAWIGTLLESDSLLGDAGQWAPRRCWRVPANVVWFSGRPSWPKHPRTMTMTQAVLIDQLHCTQRQDKTLSNFCHLCRRVVTIKWS